MIKELENPFYYLDNFERVLHWIGERYTDLLTEQEHAFMRGFAGLPRPSRALLVRMVMRKGKYFRTSKLNYAEIGCAREAALHLLPTGWIENDPHLTLEQLFELLSKPEIGTVFGLAAHQKNARKSEQLAALLPVFGDERPFSDWYRDAGDSVVAILIKPLCDRLRLIFFGNLRQDWTEFVLSDLGVHNYEQVAFSASSRGFRSRADIDHYLALHSCKERFLADEPADEVLRDLPAPSAGNEWLAGRRERLLFEIARRYERQQNWRKAYEAYAACRFPGARARAVRVLEKNGEFGPAYALLREAQADPESDAEHQQLLRIAPRLMRQLGHARAGPRPAASVPRFDLALPMPAPPWWVEGVVRDHLASPEAPVFYVENTLINALFGLLSWDAIFSAIPGAFFHPFHRGPADLHSADFFARRETQFRACLDQLDSGEYRATITRNFRTKQGIQSPFLAWDFIGQELLDMALDCIPASHLKKWFGRMLLDIKANRSGFPDLIQFWPAERRYHMIEVKGPGDRLQDNQLRWLAYCAEHQMPVSVCYLQWAEPAP
ncbi:VRR-NUC domain-containing protein [Massilia glaciei]|uniref:phosphodiesterase I n=1 Tax=Massilia glaciei TaxID=1524097 RepID=A0A2U2HMK6_9BURK|nr:VRR-NUC domain-containing protein [Massilia glaciei]PWF48733.1 VRR-NUC domain-containing protein [Massilia glaciei]